MNCSLNSVIALISAAIAALAGAIALAIIFFNLPGLIIATILVGTVTFALIPQIKAGLQAYADCRGPSETCTMSLALNTLGQAAGIISIISFAAAIALLITALAFIVSVILSWLGLTLAAAAEILQIAGCVGCGAGILILLGVMTNALAYKACRDSQSPA